MVADFLQPMRMLANRLGANGIKNDVPSQLRQVISFSTRIDHELPGNLQVAHPSGVDRRHFRIEQSETGRAIAQQLPSYSYRTRRSDRFFQGTRRSELPE